MSDQIIVSRLQNSHQCESHLQIFQLIFVYQLCKFNGIFCDIMDFTCLQIQKSAPMIMRFEIFDFI